MRRLVFVILAILSAQTAFAQIVDVRFSDTFQEQLNVDYGSREGEYLSREIITDLKRALERSNIDVRRVEVVIERATPNRPTLRQLERNPTIDLNRSFGLGGMELTGLAYDQDNQPIGEPMTYRWFERDLRNVVGFSTWTDAHRASNRFSRRFAKSLRKSMMHEENR